VSAEIININFANTSKEELLLRCNELAQHPEKWVQDIAQFTKDWLSDDDCIYLKTSGTTGAAKEIKALKTRLVNSALMTGSFFSLRDHTKALLALSPNYIAGKMMIVRSAVLKWNLFAIEPTANPLALFNAYIDVTAFVPNQLYSILNSEYADRLNKIEKIIIGGGPMSEATATLLHNFKCEVYHSYGMTETLSHVAIQQINPPGKKNYTALPGVSFTVDDRHCLIVNVPKIADEEITTNDVVILHNDKQFDWIGRWDNIINSGGIKLNPESIEDKLRPLIAQPFIISSEPDVELSNKVVLVVEQGENLNLSDLNKYLGKFEQIKALRSIQKFQYTESGKIKRKEL